MTVGALAGFGVLVTRPRHQATHIADEIVAAGGRAILFPAIEIVPRSPQVIERETQDLPDPDVVIFISSNAVRCGLPNALADNALVAAIGPATMTALESAGVHVDIAPAAGHDSESLLDEPGLLDVAGKTVRIVRGSKGREHLASELHARGAHVDYLSVYERLPARHSEAELAELEKDWVDGVVDRVTVMSVDTLTRLMESLTPACIDELRKSLLVTPSKRVIQTAQNVLPGTKVVLASGPGTDQMIEALAHSVDQH